MKKSAFIAAVWLLAVGSSIAGDGDKRPNVLFIAIDDLRPELGCYGAEQIQTPNIDKFAAEGVLFKRAYCQAPHCAPSRTSLLTGIHPRGVWERSFSVKKLARGKTTLPAAFRQAGYYTVSNGKVYHEAKDDNENSWSEPAWRIRPERLGSLDPKTYDRLSKAGRGLIYEAPDLPDEAYFDGKTAEKTIQDLRRLAKMDKPFFLACGFVKPHLPFYAPKKYWDLYQREEIEIADNRYRPKDAPKELTGSGEFGLYHLGDYELNSPDFHRMMRHGYYASTSYSDALTGDVLAELDKLGLRENTIVVVWGDHGWHLGEHNFWGKHNLLHNSTHAPLIISAPGFKKNVSTDGIVELVDIYPTLCELAGIELPDHLDGESMVPLLRDPQAPGKEVAFTAWWKGLVATTQDFTYIEYDEEPGMLFDRRTDPEENVNVVADPRYAKTVREMRKLIHPEGVEEAGQNVVELDGKRFTDADESNTVAVDAPDARFSTLAAKPGDLWRKRPTGFGIPGEKEIYERISGEPPMLRTTVRDLVPGTEVGVYVGFISNPSQSWRIRAGFEADQMATYTPTSPTGRIVDLGLVGPKATGHQYLGLIGDATVRPDGSLDVFIAHGNGKGGAQRTMYEGVAIGPPTGKAATPVFKSASGYEGQVPVPTYSEVSYGPHERNTLDFWKAESDQPAPLVVVIHGGGWMGGSKERLSRFADPVALLKAGVSVAAINYRLIPHAKDVEPPVKAPMMDSARALQFLRSKAKEWNIDPTRIGAAGASAGACTALWLAYHDDLADPHSADPVARESTRLSGVAVRGPQTSLDPKQMQEWIPNIRYGGHAFGKKNFDQFLADREAILPWIAQYSPYAQVDAGDPPSCLFYVGDPDVGKVLPNATHSPNFGAMFQKRCQEVGVPCQVVYSEDASAIARKPTEYLIELLTAGQ